MRFLSLFITIVLLIQAPYSLAASLYKCDTSYQDTPCKEQPQVKPVKKFKSQPKNNQAQLAVSANCAAKGKAAEHIMWKREVGYTLEKQTKAEKNSRKKSFIAEVYKHHGSSLTVKNAIEQECAQQEQDRLLATALEREAMRLRNGGAAEMPVEKSAVGDDRNEPVKERRLLDKEKSTKLPDNIKAEKAETCAALVQSLAEIQSKRRRGGSTRMMNELKIKQREATDRFKAEEC